MKRTSQDGPRVVFSSRRPLRVFTQNIWGFAEPYAARQRLLRDGIRKLDPDILAFQEAGRKPGSDQVREVLDGMGYRILHQFDLQAPGKFDNGVCIASRWPMDKVQLLSLQLTKHALHYPYAALAVRVHAPPPVGDFLFVNSKPSWQFNREKEREMQAVAVARMVRRHAAPQGFPPVLAGDFDAAPGNASIRFLTGQQSLDGESTHFWDCWAQAGDGSPGYTWTDANPYVRAFVWQRLRLRRHARRIDYIFLGSFHDYAQFASVRRCRVVLDRPVRGVRPSDHYAVFAEIDVSPDDAG